MQFVTHWKLREEMGVEERQEAAAGLVESGAFPPENVEIISWIGTPDGWGVIIVEAEAAADVIKAVEMWRAAAPGFFEKTKTAPAMPVQEAMAQTEELLETVS